MDTKSWLCAFSGFFSLFMFIHGIPGHIDDSKAWRVIMFDWTFYQYFWGSMAFGTGIYGTSPLWMRLFGFNVSSPQKEEVIGLMDELMEILGKILNPPDPLVDMPEYLKHIDDITGQDAFKMGALQKRLTDEKLAPPSNFMEGKNTQERWYRYLEYIKPHVEIYDVRYAQKLTRKMSKKRS